MVKNQKESEKNLYHFTKLNRILSISKKGLVPRLENNSKAVGDDKIKVSYSIGKVGAIGLFANFYSVYEDYKTGKRQPREDHPEEVEQYNIIKKSKSFEEFIGQGVYLVFDGAGITNTGGRSGGADIYDASTDVNISPDKLKVCLVKNQDTGEISYSKYDYIHYLMSTLTPQEKENMPNNIQEFFDFYYNNHLEEIEKFKKGNFLSETMKIEEFCQQYEKDIEKSENNNSKLEEHMQEGNFGPKKKIISVKENFKKLEEAEDKNFLLKEELARVVDISKPKAGNEKVINKEKNNI